MPVRKEVAEKKSSPIDLGFLPDAMVQRIDTIFDGYFGLGMKRRQYDGMEGSYAPNFPSEVASLSSGELGNTHGEYTAWYAFAMDKFKYVQVACTFIESKMDEAMDRVVGSMVADKGNIEAKKAKARSSEDYLVLVSYHQKINGVKIMLDNELKNYDRCIQSLSREISRREHNAGY